MKTEEILREIAALSPEDRVIVVDSILRDLNPPDPEVDAQWAAIVRRRLGECRLGDVAAIPGREVFEGVWIRYSQ